MATEVLGHEKESTISVGTQLFRRKAKQVTELLNKKLKNGTEEEQNCASEALSLIKGLMVIDTVIEGQVEAANRWLRGAGLEEGQLFSVSD